MAINSAGRCTQNGGMCLATPAADCATATMKQVQFDVLPRDHVDEIDLCVLKRPSRRCETRVFVAVRIADHHGLLVVSLPQVFAIQIVAQHLFENVGAFL